MKLLIEIPDDCSGQVDTMMSWLTQRRFNSAGEVLRIVPVENGHDPRLTARIMKVEVVSSGL